MRLERVATGGYIPCMKPAPATITVSIKEAKTRLTELGRRVEAGERVVVTRHGKAVFDLVPHERKGGIDFKAGQRFLRARGITDPVPYIAEDFDDPLPEDFLSRPLPFD